MSSNGIYDNFDHKTGIKEGYLVGCNGQGAKETTKYQFKCIADQPSQCNTAQHDNCNQLQLPTHVNGHYSSVLKYNLKNLNELESNNTVNTRI